MRHHHAECQSIFMFLCSSTDETELMRTFKYYEELGEFYREYLIHFAKISDRQCCSHRETSIAIILEEAIDCLIVLSRLKQDHPILPFWRPMDGYKLEQTESYAWGQLALLADGIADIDLAEVSGRLSNLLSAEDYYELIHRKLKKWKRGLMANGLIVHIDPAITEN